MLDKSNKAFIVCNSISATECCNILKTVLIEKKGHLILGVKVPS